MQKINPYVPLLALPFILLSTLSLVYFGALAPGAIPAWWPASLTGNSFVDGKLKYQFVTLGIAMLVLGLTAFLARENVRRFYRLGETNAPVEPVRWLGIGGGETWDRVGRNFALIVSLATALFLYFNVVKGESMAGENLRFLPFVVVLAAMNAFTEEAITRLSLVTALHGKLSPGFISLVSALLFGVPHYFGVPGGLIGALMAGFLGWLLAKAVLETKGLFWAWLIHFLQDVLIFGALFFAAL